MMGRCSRLFGAALLAATLGACDDLTGLADGILLDNESNASVTQVFIRDCDSSDWGSDRLGAEEVVVPDDSRLFAVGDGCYDMRAVFLSGGASEEHDVEVAEGEQYVWIVD